MKMTTLINKKALVFFPLIFLISDKGEGNEILHASRSSGGLVQLHFPLSSDECAVLHRDDELTGIKRAINIVRGNGKIAILRDPAPIPKNGFLRIQIHKNFQQLDQHQKYTQQLEKYNSGRAIHGR